MGVTRACLKEVGKEPAERERLMMVVIGWRREGRQVLRSQVGIRSRGQVEWEEERIAAETSEVEAGEKQGSRGGGEGGGIWGLEGEREEERKEAESLEILPLKKERKAEARSEVVMRLGGSMGWVVRDKRELRMDQSWRGLSLRVAILER